MRPGEEDVFEESFHLRIVTIRWASDSCPIKSASMRPEQSAFSVRSGALARDMWSKKHDDVYAPILSHKTARV